MTPEEIIRTQKHVGTEPDGFWGPKSTKAAQDHLRKMMPSPHPFPTQSNIESFYGPHGVPDGYTPPQTKVIPPYAMFYEGTPISSLHPHAKCAASLARVFDRLAVVYPTDELRRKAGVAIYDGLYNPRKMRGGSAWSMHSWAIAIDLNAEFNGNNDHWPTKAVMPIEVMECFALEGWSSAGAFWSRDAMHFQATKPE